jgi:hypothetical protein
MSQWEVAEVKFERLEYADNGIDSAQTAVSQQVHNRTKLQDNR